MKIKSTLKIKFVLTKGQSVRKLMTTKPDANKTEPYTLLMEMSIFYLGKSTFYLMVGRCKKEKLKQLYQY